MTREEVLAIKALAEKATEGPWIAKEKQDYSEIWDSDSWAKGFKPLALVGSDHGDAEFIAAARTAVPALCDEVLRLMGENEQMRAKEDARVHPRHGHWKPYAICSACGVCEPRVPASCPACGAIMDVPPPDPKNYWNAPGGRLQG